MYIDVKIEKLYLESALHGLSWKGKAYVIYLRNWTISGIACGELECITVGFKVSSLFCYRLLKSSSMISFWSFPWRWVPWLCVEKWSCSCSLAWAAPRCHRLVHDRHHNCWSILWFLLHSLLNHEKWITCIFSVKNDSMTHKTINLSDMCYFQPPILIKITVNPLFQFLMLPDKTWKIHIFQSKIV